MARVALAYQAKPGEVEALVRTRMEPYREFRLTRTEVSLAGGRKGIAISGLPGTQPYTVVYTVDEGRLYEIDLWTEQPGLDDRARMVLDSIALHAHLSSIASGMTWGTWIDGSRLRCFTCTDYDLRASSGTGGFTPATGTAAGCGTETVAPGRAASRGEMPGHADLVSGRARLSLARFEARTSRSARHHGRGRVIRASF